jgi:hypothetical protein
MLDLVESKMSLATLSLAETNAFNVQPFAVGLVVIAVVSVVGYAFYGLVVDNKELQKTVVEMERMLMFHNKRIERMEKELERVVYEIYKHSDEMKEELEARIAEVDLKCEEQIEKDNRSLSAKN